MIEEWHLKKKSSLMNSYTETPSDVSLQNTSRRCSLSKSTFNLLSMSEKNCKVKKKKTIKKESKDNVTEEGVEGKLNVRERVDDQRREFSIEKELPFEKENDDFSRKSPIERDPYAQQSRLIIEEGKENPLEEFFLTKKLSDQQSDGYCQDVHGKKLAEFMEAFHIFDFDHDGVINHEDLRKTFTSLNQTHVRDEDIQKMLSEALSPLNFDAFVILMGYKTLDLDPEGILIDALSKWDDDHNGLISHERLLHDIMVWGDKFTKEEAEAALADAPVIVTRTKEKMIDYVQFSEDLCGLRKMIQRKQIRKSGD